jgi:hypothetical protein
MYARRTHTSKRAALLAVALLGVVAAGSFQPAIAGSKPDPVERPVTKQRVQALSPQRLCPVDDLNVAESATRVIGTSWIYPGQSVTVTASGSIWAGVWFTGTNGPNGWLGTRADGTFPLPGSTTYGLIGRLGSDPWRPIGTGQVTMTNTSSNLMKKVVLRVNDNTPGNGSGAFATLTAYPCTGG